MRGCIKICRNSLLFIVLAVFLAPTQGCRTSSPGDAALWSLHGVDSVSGEAICFAPGTVSTEAFEMNAMFNSDGTEFYFTRANDSWTEMSILVSRWNGRKWGKPELLPFNGDLINADPALTEDGRRMYFASKRDAFGQPKDDFDLWYVDRVEGRWGEPQPISNLNRRYEEVCPIPGRDGSLYFTSRRPDGYGKYDIYHATWDGSQFKEPLLLKPPVNSPLTEVDATLSPDGDLLFFAGHGRQDSFGKGDIYVCFNRKGSWSSPVNLGRPVNSEAMELCPRLAPDGRTLFFASTREQKNGLGEVIGGSSDLYLVDLATLPLMKKQGWTPPKR